MALMLMNFEADDFDVWKKGFDEDPVGRPEAGATAYMISRAVDTE